MVVANDIKVEAQLEVRTLRRQLQEEQERSARLATDLEHIQGARYRKNPNKASLRNSGAQSVSIALLSLLKRYL